ncbi:MAG: MFS transporter [Thermodesulfobacteriota bacterium]
MKERPLIFYGWLIVLIIVVSMMLIYGIRHSFAVFFSRILAEFGWSRGDTAMMFSLNVFVYGIFAPLAGSMGEHWKPKIIMPLGIGLLGLATAGCALAQKLWHFYLLFGFLMPLGSALSGWPIMAPALINWFRQRRGLVLGLGQMGGGLSFLYSLFVEVLISSLGWRNAFLILALLLGAFLFPLYLFFFHYRPEEKGLQPYGEDFSGDKESAKKTENGQTYIPAENRLIEVLKSSRLWLLVLSYALFWGVGCYLILAHQVRFMQDMGYDSFFSASIFALLGITLVVGQLSGFLSDLLGREKTVTLASLLSIGGILALVSVQDISHSWLLYIFAIAFGYGIGLYSPTLFASTADIFPGRHYGVAAGLLLMGMGIGGIIGPWLGGYLFDLFGHYFISFILCMACLGVAIIFLWLAAPRLGPFQRANN